MKEVICPACGALTEGRTDDEIYQATLEHTLDAHGYDIPRDHVLASVVETRDG
jgi:predicted small metal-binding protein